MTTTRSNSEVKTEKIGEDGKGVNPKVRRPEQTNMFRLVIRVRHMMRGVGDWRTRGYEAESFEWRHIRMRGKGEMRMRGTSSFGRGMRNLDWC